MRVIEALVPGELREDVVARLEDADVEFVFTPGVSGDGEAGTLFVPLDDTEADAVIDLLHDAGVDREGYVVVTHPEAVVTDRTETPIEDDEEDDEPRVPREELRSLAVQRAGRLTIDAAFTVLSAIIVTAGLLIDSPTVVTGAMVIAPLLGPIVVTSVGNVLGDRDLIRYGVLAQGGGVLIAVTSATAFALLVRFTVQPSVDFAVLELIQEFSNPVVLTLVIALAAGTAGALSLTAGVDSALVGVAAAAALVPPTGVVGIGVAYGEPAYALGGGVLLIVNLLSINLTHHVTLWAQGYRPEEWYEHRRVKRLLTRRVVTMAVAVMLVSAVVGAVSLEHRHNAAFEADVRDAAEVDANVVSLTVEYERGALFSEPSTVVVYVTDAPPGYAETLRERIRRRTEVSVRVVVFEASSVAPGG